MKDFVEVAAAIITHEGKYLISERPSTGHLPGKWEFVGGKRKTGETVEQCVIREVKEEVGADITLWSCFQVVEHKYADRQVKIHFFNCHLNSTPPDPIVYPHIRWVALDELPFYDFAEATRPIVQALFTTLEL